MIDLHSHLIPCIDDGARDKAEALSLLKIAEQDGITKMVITPHIHIGRFDNTKNGIFDAFFDLKWDAEKAGINIELAVAAEVRIDLDILNLITQRSLPFLGKFEGKSVLLLELPHSNFPVGTENLIKWLNKENIIPMIAHPERNRDIQKTPQLATKLKSFGCMLQCTAASITGEFGKTAQTCAFNLLDQNLFDVVASDAHSVKRRPPILSAAYDVIANNYSDDLAKSLFIEAPRIVTEGMFL